MGKNKQKQLWKAGDCFGIPLVGGDFLLGQVLAAEPSVLNSVSCALFNQRFENQPPPRPNLREAFSAVMTTRDLLDSGQWKVMASYPVEFPRASFPFESLRRKGFVGATVVGSRNIAELANAFCGLSAWDDWADPHYLDRLLLKPELKPTNLRYKT